ncbi:helix-turn-helix transcriptional regulator [Ancylobacter sp. A5.8]|uniref:helix-turn-helix transcriptional regulator n=1 Tax=Ancylobacter gelatini TaxID=2919920 RepID=UPI001F4DC480|nr:helix-turn-helix transcriptional regulator [Ancylobacter gelatini]MCJ8144341.1 helix-turn-helix transcriptional regulator [Ancylobacter gelatini]
MLTFSNAVYRIYQATLSPQHWLDALDGVASLCDSDGSFITARGGTDWVMVLNSTSLDQAMKAVRTSPWMARNIWLERLNEAAYRVGDVYRDQDVATPEEIETHPFYVDFLPSVGLGWNMAAIIHSDFGAPTGLLVQRAREKGPYTRAEMDALQRLSRHVEQSLRISARLVDGQSLNDTLTRTLDSLDRPTFILDPEQRPVHINRQALGLMGRYFTEEDGRLVPVAERERAVFSAAVRSALGDADDQKEGPQPITLSTPTGEAPLVAWILPLVGASADRIGAVPRGERVVVLVQTLNGERSIDPTVIRNVFGLTLGEARLAAQLGAGHSLRQSAAELGITEGTARVVLKRVFQKMGVQRQSQLVANLVMFGGTGRRAADPVETSE